MKYTVQEYLALKDIKTTANPSSVYDLLKAEINQPVFWDAPLDDAEYITQLGIGNPEDDGLIYLTFSTRGNLCLVEIKGKPVIDSIILDRVLSGSGWDRIPAEDWSIELYPATHGTVGDQFFSYL